MDRERETLFRSWELGLVGVSHVGFREGSWTVGEGRVREPTKFTDKTPVLVQIYSVNQEGKWTVHLFVDIESRRTNSQEWHGKAPESIFQFPICDGPSSRREIGSLRLEFRVVFQ